MTRTCEADRQWSGDEPSCERKNEVLFVETNYALEGCIPS